MKRRADVKVAIAAGRLAAQLGAAQIPEAYPARDAERQIALVSLGKRSIMYRIGLDATERPFAIEELATMLKRARGRGREPRWALPIGDLRVAAAIALDGLAVDLCPKCGGRSALWSCRGCSAARSRLWGANERLLAGGRVVNDLEYSAVLMAVIEASREILLSAEAAAADAAARMAGGWGA